jgi:heparan-alpha-glucosaminide N-acetyltransferase
MTSMNQPATPARSFRITSIDALRGFVMFTMIYVNDLDENISPPWMKHFHGRNGMTFVDLVFPAFVFIVGMAIPIAMSGRLAKGESDFKLFGHVLLRTLSLLTIGIMMVNSESGESAKLMGFSPTVWEASMFGSALLAFCSIGSGGRASRVVTTILRIAGTISLIALALVYRSPRDGHILTLSPFHIHASWFGILGLIAWAYLIASLVFLIFHTNRTAILACCLLLLGLYAAEHKGAFEGFWLSRYVNIGEHLGAHPAIAVAGVLLGTILLTPDTVSVASRTRFTILFALAFAAGAMLVYRIWGISKNAATPSWCLWSMAITAVLWLIFYFAADVLHVTFLTKPWEIAGRNVLLAYILSEMMESVLDLLHLGDWYDNLAQPDLLHAASRSIGCAIFILVLTSLLNRVGFRLKL